MTGIILIALFVGISNFMSKEETNKPVGNSTNNKASKQGNALVESVLDKVKAQVPTVEQTRVLTENTDGNNLLGKQGTYQYAGSFYDTRTKYEPSEELDGSSDISKANYGVSAGGTIEVFANSSDAKKRYDYIQSLNGTLGAPEADRQVGNVLLRVSENYTATQQKEMLDIMQKAL